MEITLNIIIGLCIYIPLFFYFYFKFKEKYTKLKTVLISGLLSYFIIGFITVIVIILISNFNGYFTSNSKFDSTEFKSNYKSRLSMKNDIIENKLFLNKSKTTIESLLGKPSVTNEGKWQYGIGHTGVLSPTFYTLEFGFENDKCNNIKIILIEDN